MSKAGARAKLRELLAPIAEKAVEEFTDPDIEDGIRLLVVVAGGSEELMVQLVEQAGLNLLDPLGDLFLDEDEGDA